MTATPNSQPRATFASRLLVALLAGIFLLGAAGFLASVLSANEAADASPSPSPSASAAAAAQAPIRDAASLRLTLAAPLGTAAATAVDTTPAPSTAPSTLALSTAPSREPLAAVSPSAAPSTGPLAPDVVEQSVPVVPVVSFWSKQTNLKRAQVVRALRTGSLGSYSSVIVEGSLAEPLAAGLGVDLHAAVRTGDVAAIERAVSHGALGLLAAAHVTPRVRALAVNGVTLFGNERLRSSAQWPLSVTLQTGEEDAWSDDQVWVLVAAGDSFTDRGVYSSVVLKGRGVDYPFDGGTARVTGHGCCDPIFHTNVVPRYVLTGNKGTIRRLFKKAELAIVNHEEPTTPAAVHHTSGTRFSGKPKLAKMFRRAGIDWVSLANNHIKDYGTDGIAATRKILRKAGVAFGGAGKNLEQARRISYLHAANTTIAIIPCVGVAPSSWAGPKTSGGTPCLDRYLVKDIKRAARQADFVIVFPHWGVEYTRKPLPSMRKHAAKWVRAGADLILGGHSHVAGAIEDIDGIPVLYSLGNFIFDQNWSTNTMESMLVEATFDGSKLSQLRLRPYIIHNQSQPNLLDPAVGEGRRLLQQVRQASKGWLDW